MESVVHPLLGFAVADDDGADEGAEDDDGGGGYDG